ncbi:IclR family transcriptional regulator [Williamsia sp. 1135]|uniref:IclR family transcriptional regulator n=1 Tax=Williamsia sp. 1135 TaxID=1889262 RepID=UPI000A105A54|nr:IclR family transcriptional regulator [Williamsia sp. 1135]ORM25137.1 hypothetical protein BFL43_25725 [Williamsia sp. 1135]
MPGLIQSVERATAVLHLLATRSEPVGLTEIASTLGLAKTTAHGLVRTLVAVGAVEQTPDTAGYWLADDPFGARKNRWDLNEVRARAMNWTDALAARTALATQISVLQGKQARIVHDVLSASGVGLPSLRTGQIVPAHASALGRIHLAFDVRLARELVAGGLDRHTHRTITDGAELAHELAEVRDRGWACGCGDLDPEVATIAAPVRDQGGVVMAAVGVSGAIDELCGRGGAPRAPLLDNIIGSARSISRAMGHGQLP